MKNVITIFFLVHFLPCVFSQHDKTIDSLKQVLSISSQDTNKVYLLHAIGSHYQISFSDTAMIYANQELKLSEQLKFQKGVALSYLLIGTIKQYKNIDEEALKYYMLSIKISEQISNKKLMAAAMVGIGIISQNAGNARKAIDYYEKALKIREEINDKMGISACLNNLSGIYYNRGDRKTAKTYILRCLKSGEETGSKTVIASSLNGLANISLEDGNLSDALEYSLKALKMYEEMQSFYDIVLVLNNRGEIYLKLKKLNEALSCYKKALEMAQSYDILEFEADALGGLAVVYEKTNNYKLAYQYRTSCSELKDSILNKEARDQVLEMSAKYETEKNEKEIEILNKEKVISTEQNKRKNIIAYSLIAGLLLVLIFSLFLFNRFNVTRKQKHIIEEKQKEITDSITYAKRLQIAILPPESYWKSHLSQSFVLYQPKDIVSGDFYWVENVNDLILFAAADCTGHGVSGAMVSVVCSNALNRTVKEFDIFEPNKILDKVRELVLETFAKSESDIKDGMDISLCCLNSKTKQLLWSGANNPLWYIRENNLNEIKGDKHPIGKTDNPKPFTPHTIQLQELDTLYVFTDGYADQFGGQKNKKFMNKSLKNLLLEIHQQPIQAQKELLLQRFAQWKGNTEQTDDVLIIGLKV